MDADKPSLFKGKNYVFNHGFLDFFSMSAIQIKSLFTTTNVEDWALLLSPLVLTPSFQNLLGISTSTAFLLSVILAALGKSLIGVSQWPSSKNYEDWFLLVLSVVSLVGVGLQVNPEYSTAVLLIGLFVKAALSFTTKPIQIEDVILAIGAFIGAVATVTGYSHLANIAILLSTFGKSLPGIAGVNSSVAPQSSLG